MDLKERNQSILQLIYQLFERMKVKEGLLLSGIGEKPTEYLGRKGKNNKIQTQQKRFIQNLIDLLSDGEGKEHSENKMEKNRCFDSINEKAKAYQNLTFILLKAWKSLKQAVLNSSTFTAKIESIEKMFSIQQLNIILPGLLILYQYADLSISGYKDKVLVKAKGAINRQAEEHFKILSNLLIIKSNIDWIHHENTAEKHHLALYENFDVLKIIDLFSRLPSSSKNGEGLWWLEESFIKSVKNNIFDKEIDLIPEYFKMIVKSGISYIGLKEGIQLLKIIPHTSNALFMDPSVSDEEFKQIWQDLQNEDEGRIREQLRKQGQTVYRLKLNRLLGELRNKNYTSTDCIQKQL